MEDPSRMEEMPVDVDMVHLGAHYAGEALRSLAEFQGSITMGAVGSISSQLTARRKISNLAVALEVHSSHLRRCVLDADARATPTGDK